MKKSATPSPNQQLVQADTQDLHWYTQDDDHSPIQSAEKAKKLK